MNNSAIKPPLNFHHQDDDLDKTSVKRIRARKSVSASQEVKTLSPIEHCEATVFFSPILDLSSTGCGHYRFVLWHFDLQLGNFPGADLLSPCELTAHELLSSVAQNEFSKLLSCLWKQRSHKPLK